MGEWVFVKTNALVHNFEMKFYNLFGITVTLYFNIQEVTIYK